MGDTPPVSATEILMTKLVAAVLVVLGVNVSAQAQGSTA